MKFDQLIEYNKRNIFLQNYAESETERLVPDLFLFFKKVSYELKTSGLKFQYISIAFNLEYNKSKLYKTLDYFSKTMLNFGLLEKGLGIVSSPHFVHFV